MQCHKLRRELLTLAILISNGGDQKRRGYSMPSTTKVIELF